MKLTFQKAFQTLMFYFEIELLLKQRLGGDLGKLLLSFLKEDPMPWHWPINPQPSPWDPLGEVDPHDGIGLPLFAP